MALDLSKLTPAPWEADGYGGTEDSWDIGHPCLDKQGREDFLYRGHEMTKADAEFCALARNAFAGDPEALAWWEENRVEHGRRVPHAVLGIMKTPAD